MSRNLDQRIILILPDGREIQICICSLKLGVDPAVRIGVDAPKDVAVHREEVWERIKEEREERIKESHS